MCDVIGRAYGQRFDAVDRLIAPQRSKTVMVNHIPHIIGCNQQWKA